MSRGDYERLGVLLREREIECQQLRADLEKAQGELRQVDADLARVRGNSLALARERDRWQAAYESIAQKLDGEERAHAETRATGRSVKADVLMRWMSNEPKPAPSLVELWDAINRVVTASGGNAGNTSVARQKAVVGVERVVGDLLRAAREAGGR
jgi:hypothetical protein